MEAQLFFTQNCVLAAKCPHAGCHEGKLLHLHLKTCKTTGPEFECPTRHNGCQQARKLLAHYRRCRSIRARQAGQPPGGGGKRDSNAQQACLVCSLVARQARTMLLEGVNTQKLSANGSNKMPAPLKASAGTRKAVSSFLLATDVGIVDPAVASSMPPPPRRSELSPPQFQMPSAPPIEVHLKSFEEEEQEEVVTPELEHEVGTVSRRQRSVSHADASLTKDMGTGYSQQMSRSASTGALCETIAEEESHGSSASVSKESMGGELDLNIDLVHHHETSASASFPR